MGNRCARRRRGRVYAPILHQPPPADTLSLDARGNPRAPLYGLTPPVWQSLQLT